MSYVYSVGELAQHLARKETAGGTYAVLIAPSRSEGVAFTEYPWPANGRFAVGGASCARVFPADLGSGPGRPSVGAVARAVAEMAKRASIIGAWRDAQGRLWLDEVDTYEDKGYALLVARSRGELAVWDGVKAEEVALDSPAAREWLAEHDRAEAVASTEQRAGAYLSGER